jgi:hypothetical protein
LKQQPNVAGRRLPLVVQLGFAGSRSLYERRAHPGVDAGKFHGTVEAYLTERLRHLPELLGFDDEHFLCGISQLAVGADTVFTRTCQSLDIPQRIFLTEHRDEFLGAFDQENVPDFSEAERVEALELLASPHVIQERVVSDSADREIRFQDVNREIARVSDLLVCLVREGASAKPGGTQDLINRGRQRNVPVLEIRVGVDHGLPAFSEEWHGRTCFRRPDLPEVLAAARLPDGDTLPSNTAITSCCQALKDLGDAQANWQRKLFKWVASIIIGTHVLATILAAIVLASHVSKHHTTVNPTVSVADDETPASAVHVERPHAQPNLWEAVILWLLGIELLSLAVGFGVHYSLHHSHACHRWAMSRLVAEVARSVIAFGSVHVYLEYLFALPFPSALRPLLRTINVLHLRSARRDSADWESKRNTYVAMRLTAEDGQINYYRNAAVRARRWLHSFHWTFLVCSGGAILATSIKLLVIAGFNLHVDHDDPAVTGTLGGLAIALPVLAVAALSLAAAMDLEARKHTYAEMLAFLEEQKDRLNQAATERDFVRLLLETESRQLGEIANWFSRRSFTGVA